MSDVHLSDAESVKARIVIRFLQTVASRFEKIFILGDFFEAWPVTSDYLLDRFKPLIRTFRELVRDGHEVHYFEGNHDFHLGKYFESIGVKVHTEAAIFNWNGKRIYLAHGDLGNPSDYSYRAFRTFSRLGAVRFALKHTPPQWIFKAGLKASRLSRSFRKRRPSCESIKRIYRGTAEKIFKEGCDVVLMGHTHLPDDVTQVVDGRECRYINTGDWVANFTYVEYDGNQFFSRTHPLKNAN